MITVEEIKEWQKEKEVRQFVTNFNFLRVHNGWRKGKIHTILGVSHGGKSTLTRTLVLDAVGNSDKPKKIGVVLSEESEVDFLTDIISAGVGDFSHFAIFGELEQNFNSVREYFTRLSKFVDENKIDILFYDNLTTSFTYMDRPVKEQSEVTKKLKSFAIDKNIPLVAIAHTGANVTENYSGIIEMNDIRGAKTIVNLSEFFYVMQSFYTGSDRYNTIKIAKNRGYNVTDRLYSLFYYPSKRIFGKDKLMHFDELQEIYKKRNRL